MSHENTSMIKLIISNHKMLIITITIFLSYVIMSYFSTSENNIGLKILVNKFPHRIRNTEVLWSVQFLVGCKSVFVCVCSSSFRLYDAVPRQK